jgi:hypothetical protein
MQSISTADGMNQAWINSRRFSVGRALMDLPFRCWPSTIRTSHWTPNFVGTKQRRPYRFKGNRLIFSGKQAADEDDQTFDR